jgi:hypothetical protein
LFVFAACVFFRHLFESSHVITHCLNLLVFSPVFGVWGTLVVKLLVNREYGFRIQPVRFPVCGLSCFQSIQTCSCRTLANLKKLY